MIRLFNEASQQRFRWKNESHKYRYYLHIWHCRCRYTLSDNVSTIMKTLFIHYFHSLKINNFNLSHLSVNIKNLFADGTRLTYRQGNNITLASYNIVVLKYFAHEKFVIVNESETQLTTNNLRIPKFIILNDII